MVVFCSWFLWFVLVLAVVGFMGSIWSIFGSVGRYVDSTECFDCGIDPLSQPRVPICVPFFMIVVIFVVFDGEMLLCLPLVLSPTSVLYWWFWVLFLGLLFLGLVFELLMETIDWKE